MKTKRRIVYRIVNANICSKDGELSSERKISLFGMVGYSWIGVIILAAVLRVGGKQCIKMERGAGK
jgi:hypothetical protein